MCEMVSCNVLNDVSKCYYVAEMDENKYQYQRQKSVVNPTVIITCSPPTE
jgi:hypothetical protein